MPSSLSFLAREAVGGNPLRGQWRQLSFANIVSQSGPVLIAQQALGRRGCILDATHATRLKSQSEMNAGHVPEDFSLGTHQNKRRLPTVRQKNNMIIRCLPSVAPEIRLRE
jgi:hypothetical protein